MEALNIDWNKVKKFVYELDSEGTLLSYVKAVSADSEGGYSEESSWTIKGNGWSRNIEEETILNVLDGLKMKSSEVKEDVNLNERFEDRVARKYKNYKRKNKNGR